MTKTIFFSFPSYKRALCSICLPPYVNLFLFFPLELPLNHVLAGHPTVCVCTEAAFSVDTAHLMAVEQHQHC